MVVNAIAAVVRVLALIPPIGRRMQASASYKLGGLFRLQERGEHALATRAAIAEMLTLLDRIPSIDGTLLGSYWWMYAKVAAESAEVAGDPALRHLVVQTVTRGPMPLEGYHVAFSYLSASRWMLASAPEDARRLAGLAVRADPTWPEARIWFQELGELDGSPSAD